ncbi:MAG: alkyl hydroperoxide reductase subunit D [Sphingobacteriales bacterium]|jgi:alkyl hydroperoxide reductase subunit D
MSNSKENLFLDLGLESELQFLKRDSFSKAFKKNYLADISRNFNSAFNKPTLSPLEASLLCVGASLNSQNQFLVNLFTTLAKESRATEEEIAETLTCTSLMATNNVLFRFKHAVDNETYKSIPAGIRMSIKLNPLLGTEFYEILSLVISSINGCTACINEHESHAIKAGATEQKISDAIRLGAIVHGLSVVLSYKK